MLKIVESSNSGGNHRFEDCILHSPQSTRRPKDLTRREIECLHLLARGQSNAGIGRHLHISLPTVAMHLQNARVKLGAATREQAVAIVVATGVIAV